MLEAQRKFLTGFTWERDDFSRCVKIATENAARGRLTRARCELKDYVADRVGVRAPQRAVPNVAGVGDGGRDWLLHRVESQVRLRRFATDNSSTMHLQKADFSAVPAEVRS